MRASPIGAQSTIWPELTGNDRRCLPRRFVSIACPDLSTAATVGETQKGSVQMTGPIDELDRAVRNFLAKVPPGERIETLALATMLLVQLNDNRPIEEARAIVRAEAPALGVEWWDEK